MRRYLLLLFLCLSHAVWSQSCYEYRYWFDTDDASPQTGTSTSGSWHIDAGLDELSCSLHAIHIQVKDEEGEWSVPVTRYFVKSATRNIRGYYWMDNDTEMKTLESLSGELSIDVSDLSDGFHVFRCQVEDGDAASVPVMNMFLKIPQTEGVEYLTCVCSIDGEQYKQEKVTTSGGIVSWPLEVDDLYQGLHRIQIQVVTPSGAATNIVDRFFFRSTTAAEYAGMKLLYAVDEQDYYSQSGTSSGGLYHFDVDVASLEDGLHRITYMLMSDTGTSTKVSTAFFIKTPVGGPGIMNYRYWFNENETKATTVKLEKRTNPFELITLLPVESQPLRSSSFHFEISDGVPMIYPKNDLHMQFFDVSGRMTEMTSSYADYSVSQAIGEIKELVSGQTETMTRPETNEISWYKVTAVTGDSLVFKASSAVSIQVFSPSGNELYNASGTTSVTYGGCYANEDGTYYVAVHDPTSTGSSAIKLDYLHLDKYAVLSYTPHEIGVLGESIVDMTFNGNGYDKLASAYLRSESANLVPDSIIVKSKSEMILRFNIFGEEKFGDYDVVLLFDDGEEKDSLVIGTGMSIAEGVWQEPEISVSYSRTLESPYPVKISVKNKSNVGLLYLPVNIAFDNIGLIEKVDFNNFFIPVDSLAYEEGYSPLVVTDNFLGKGTTAAVLNMFIPQIAPNETKEYVLKFTAPGHTRFNLYAWTGKPINHPDETPDTLTNIPSIYGYYDQVGYYKNNESRSMNVSSVQRAKSSAHLEWIELRRPINLANDLADISVTNGHLIGGIVNGAAHYNDMEHLRAYGIDPSDPLYDEIKNLHKMESPTEIFNDPNSLSNLLASLWENMQRNATNGNPTPSPNAVEILNPGDPNDIFGYVSESGSKYVRDSLLDVYYTIEFENDPELATAAAHTIIVTDTIDGSVHDLSSFVPKSIKLGDVYTELDGEANFIKTIDMRPRINVIAQVSCEYDESTGIAELTIESLDPMTMEPTIDAMDGVLPINVDGNGQGEFIYDIRLNSGLECGKEINNRASIVFDNEEAILTPVWTNVIDNVAPESAIVECVAKNDTISVLRFEGTDNLSGIWKYDLYVQNGKDALWVKAVENITDSLYEYKVEAGLDYGFCVLASDSAGNIEKKELVREATLNAFKIGDANGDGVVDVLDQTLAIGKYLGEKVSLNVEAADVNSDGVVDAYDATLIQGIYLSTSAKKIMVKRIRKSKIQ